MDTRRARVSPVVIQLVVPKPTVQLAFNPGPTPVVVTVTPVTPTVVVV